jgi:hypothetical protein
VRRAEATAARLALPISLLLCLCAAAPAAPATAASCPNEARRAEQGPTALGLPDCRAYELVNPGGILGNDGEPVRAASAGGAVSYYTNHPTSAATSTSFFYLARRGEEGWTNRSIGPQNEGGANFAEICSQNVFLSSALTAAVLEAGWYSPSSPGRCKRPEALVPGEPDPYRNVFLTDGASSAYRLLNAPPPGATPENARFQAASDDMSHVVFAEAAQLTPEAPPGYDFYLWSEGSLRLLTFLPDGSPVAGELAEATWRPGTQGNPSVQGSGFAPFTGALSSDGRRAFFYANGNLYVRLNADRPQSIVVAGHCTEQQLACTLQVDASQGPGGGGGGNFWRATPTGDTVFFTDDSRLTPDSTALPGKPDLYRFDVGTGHLADLTVDATEAADVQGVSAVSSDGSYVYFVANGALATGVSPGDCPGTVAVPGHCGLYVLHEGTTELIATLSGADGEVWQEGAGSGGTTHKSGRLAASISPNGRYLAFGSSASLAGFDTTDARFPESHDTEIYLYEALAAGGSGSLSCASCPAGAPTSSSTLVTAGEYGPDVGGENDPNAKWMSAAVLDDGTVFFDSFEALVGGDVNDTRDAYEYRYGEQRLLSPGDGASGSHFLGASADGTDVFIRTGERLLGRDNDSESLSMYDVRRGGGFAEPPAPPTPCEGTSCRIAVGAPPAPLAPATRTVVPAPPKRPCTHARGKRRCRQGGHHRRGHKHHRHKRGRGR